MECSIEDGYLWNCWKKFLHSHDALEVSGIVERTEDCTFLDDIDNLIGNQAGLGDLHAAMQHTVTYSLNLFSRLQHAILRVEQMLLEDEFNGSSMLEHEVFNDDLRSIGSSKLEERIGQTNLFNTTLGNDVLIVEYLILEGRGTAVQYENFH